jgi:hypothetical protein
VETREIVEALVTQKHVIFEEESITFHHTTYNRVSQNLSIEKVNTKNKKSTDKWESTIDFDEVAP